MNKLQAPPNITSFSHEGFEIPMDEDGIVDVSSNPRLIPILKDHGFTEIQDAKKGVEAAPVRRRPAASASDAPEKIS